jgi:hypothetical protein
VSTRTSNAKRLKLIAATALGLDALTFFVGTLFLVATGSFDNTIFVPFVVTGVLAYFAWLGLRSAGLSGGCLLPLAFFGFCFWALGAALSGVSLAYFLLFLVLWSLIPLIAGILFLFARRIEGPPQRSSAGSGEGADLW